MKQNDVTVNQQLGYFTLAQIMEFIHIAIENQCSEVLTMLLDYKEKHFTSADPLAEFTLDLL